MNKNKIVKFQTKKAKGLFISVPYTTIVEQCFFKDKESLKFALMVCYGLRESCLTFIPIVIPEGNYKIVGLSNSLDKKQVAEHLGVPFKEYLKILWKQDITINYSDSSNFWMVVVLK